VTRKVNISKEFVPPSTQPYVIVTLFTLNYCEPTSTLQPPCFASRNSIFL